MTTEAQIFAAKTLKYDPATDAVTADGEYVGGADVMTREIMLKLVDNSWHSYDDEALFDALFPGEGP